MFAVRASEVTKKAESLPLEKNISVGYWEVDEKPHSHLDGVRMR